FLFVYLTYSAFILPELKTVIAAIAFFGLFVFFAFPVLKNQIIEVTNKSIILYNFGYGIELKPDDLYKVIKRKGRISSYRFQRGGYRFQISPSGYYNAEKLQELFDKLFDKICHYDRKTYQIKEQLD
ncbi:MAG: hypothetical protein ACQERN_09490, partial [Thermodesulfobacteriota bacterium]